MKAAEAQIAESRTKIDQALAEYEKLTVNDEDRHLLTDIRNKTSEYRAASIH